MFILYIANNISEMYYVLLERQVIKLTYTQAQNKATQKYIKANLEQISIRVPKGKREQYNRLAKEMNTSLTKLITEYLDRLMNEKGI